MPGVDDDSLGKIKTEHAEFPMEPRCSPGWVLGNHLENQFPNLLRRLFPSTCLRTLEISSTYENPVPADDSFRFDDEESLFPS
jgi:hypothetical protein